MSGKKKASSRRSTKKRPTSSNGSAQDAGTSTGEGAGDGGGDDDNDGGGEEPTPRPQLTKKQLKELFTNYQEKADLLEEANEAIQVIKSDLSARVEAIYDALGAGPFKWKGKELRINKRGGTFYMKKTGDTMEID